MAGDGRHADRRSTGPSPSRSATADRWRRSRPQPLRDPASEAGHARPRKRAEHILGAHRMPNPVRGHLDHYCDDLYGVRLEKLDEVVVRVADDDASPSERPGREVPDVPGDDRARRADDRSCRCTWSSESGPGIEATRCSYSARCTSWPMNALRMSWATRSAASRLRAPCSTHARASSPRRSSVQITSCNDASSRRSSRSSSEIG